MDERQIGDLHRKLRLRGFKQDAVRERCDACGENAASLYKILARSGGRDIKWCLACGNIRSWKRTADDKLVEDTGFDLVKFLEQKT